MWEVNGIKGQGDCPAIAGKYSGPLVIMGSGHCLWDDLAKVEGAPQYMAVNWSGCFAGKRLEHWVSKHPESLPPMVELYMQTYFPTNTDNPNFNFFAHIYRPHIYTHAQSDAEVVWEFDIATRGSSSMFAVLVGLALGYAPIWLAGVPLDSRGTFYDSPYNGGFNYECFREHWKPMVDICQGRVKSFSGFTRELLGEPN